MEYLAEVTKESVKKCEGGELKREVRSLVTVLLMHQKRTKSWEVEKDVLSIFLVFLSNDFQILDTKKHPVSYIS